MKIHPSAQISPRAIIGDDVEIGAGCTVQANAVIEGRTTIGRDNRPWMVRALGHEVEIELAGPMLFLLNDDRPGMIGRVGTLLGAADVNISSMDVGRLGPRQSAMMVLRLDDPIPPAVLEEICAQPDITKAYGLVI